MEKEKAVENMVNIGRTERERERLVLEKLPSSFVIHIVFFNKFTFSS